MSKKKLRKRDIFTMLDKNCVSHVTTITVKEFIERILEDNKKLRGIK